MAVDPTYKANSFNKPKVLTEKESYIRGVLMILFGKPGFFPSIPTLGMDIQQYMYLRQDQIYPEVIKAKLATQCRDFMPDINAGDLDIIVTMQNNRVFLVFMLPMIDDKEGKRLILGITTDNSGNISYKYIEE